MKHLPIDVRRLAQEFDSGTDNPFDGWLNLETGELVLLPHRDSFDEEEEQEEEKAQREEIETKLERFVEVPRLETREQFKFMERFADAHPDRDLLLRALNGKGAFGRFKDTCARLGALEAWHRFHEGAIEQLARDWLEQRGITAPPVVHPELPAAPPPPQVPNLVDLLIWGGPPARVAGKVKRVMEAQNDEQARRYFAALARSICNHVGEEWRKRLIENTNRFERNRFALEVDGKRIVLTVDTDPWVVSMFH